MKNWFLLLALSAFAWGQKDVVVNANSFSGADCGAKINAAEASLASTAAAIEVDSSCGTSTWSAVTLTNDHHTLRFLTPGPFTVNSITLSGSYDAIAGPAYLTQVGGTAQIEVVLKGNDDRVASITCDGSAPQTPANGTGSACFEVLGNRNTLENNKVVTAQGNGITVAGIGASGVCSSTANDNIIKNNLINKVGASAVASGITVGNNSKAAGACTNRNRIEGNTIAGTSGNCIYATADIGTSGLPTSGTQTSDTKILNNTVSGCGDSPIEASDMVVNTLIQGNTVDCTKNACILSREAVSTQIIQNTVQMEPSALQAGISIGPPIFQAPSFDNRAVVANNTVRGYVVHFGISVSQSGARITGNDIEDTYRPVGPDGSGLGGDGIACSGANVSSCFIDSNQIKHVLVGIDFNYSATAQSGRDFVATNNRISQVGTGINLYQLRCTNCNISKNFITQVRTVAVQDNGPNANGTGTSYSSGNILNLPGWAGANPKPSVQNLPGYQH